MMLIVSFHQGSVVLNVHQIIQALMVQPISPIAMNLKKKIVFIIISQCLASKNKDTLKNVVKTQI